MTIDTHDHSDHSDRDDGSRPGEPTEAAKLLHGDQAAVETNPQPDVIVLDSGTRIARPEPADDEDSRDRG